MICAPNTPAANRFPWRFFFYGTKLRKGSFKALFRYEDFLETVADAYESKCAMLTDKEMLQCVEKVYFPMFRANFISSDVFLSEAPMEVEKMNQPQIDGFVFDRNAANQNVSKLTRLRSALKVFSKDLYGDSHAWFSDFEEYFRQQQNSD